MISQDGDNMREKKRFFFLIHSYLSSERRGEEINRFLFLKKKLKNHPDFRNDADSKNVAKFKNEKTSLPSSESDMANEKLREKDSQWHYGTSNILYIFRRTSIITSGICLLSNIVR